MDIGVCMDVLSWMMDYLIGSALESDFLAVMFPFYIVIWRFQLHITNP